MAKLFGKESQSKFVHRQSIKKTWRLVSRVTAVDLEIKTVEAIESVDEHQYYRFTVALRLWSMKDGNFTELFIY